MTRNMLSKIENGRAAPSVKTLEHLSAVLDVPMSYFLENDDYIEKTVDLGQLCLIDELASELIMTEPSARGYALCVKARVMMTEGRLEEALTLFDGFEKETWPPAVLFHIYMVLEDCHRGMGEFRIAYEYALKRLAED